VVTRRGRRTTVAAAVRLGIFLAVATAVTVTVAATIRPIGGGDRHELHAVFTSASDLEPGDQVRVAGVVSGRVTAVRLDEDAHARISFEVAEDVPVTAGTRAEIRYLNLIGNRYLALLPGSSEAPAGDTDEVLSAGATIPLERTRPALDLDQLFAGFKPLFAALSPDDANALAESVVATFQGEGATVESLLSHTAQVTSNLADRDAVIGRVIENLGTVLATADRNQAGLNELLRQLDRYVGGLAADRQALGSALEGIEALSSSVAGLVEDARPAVRDDIRELRRLAATLDTAENRDLVERALLETPEKLGRITRVASYGSFFNFYLCTLRLDIEIGTGPAADAVAALLGDLGQITLQDSSARCEP
jgi:phospholipid/cholesterol/gamma-HCH transport system substrate-binding protein